MFRKLTASIKLPRNKGYPLVHRLSKVFISNFPSHGGTAS